MNKSNYYKVVLPMSVKRYKVVLQGFYPENKTLPSYRDLLINYDPFYLNDM